MKKSGMKKLSFLMAVLLCAGSVLAGCGESAVQEEPGAPVTNDVSVPSAEAETVPETEETVLSDNVPLLFVYFLSYMFICRYCRRLSRMYNERD